MFYLVPDSYSRPQTRESVESGKNSLEYESFEYESRLDTALLPRKEREGKGRRELETRGKGEEREEEEGKESWLGAGAAFPASSLSRGGGGERRGKRKTDRSKRQKAAVEIEPPSTSFLLC